MEPDQVIESVFKSADAAQAARKQILANFNSQGQLSGNKWPDLADRTWKRKKSSQMLVENGRLRNDVANATVTFLNEYLVVEVPNPVAGFHQSGTKRLPKRPPVEFPTDAARKIAEDLSSEIVQQLKNEGFQAEVDVSEQG